MVTPLTIEGLQRLDLAYGPHPGPESGVCLLEAVGWMAGEPWSDTPACASPVLAAFGRSLNDQLDHKHRQKLKPLVPLLVGTVDPAADQRDGLRCAHYLVAVWTPAWLDLVPGLAVHAVELRRLPEPGSWDDVAVWRRTLAAARAAAGAAAGDAAGDAAWAAVGDAAWAAAWAAAGAAARAAVGAAAWAAAGDAAGAAAWAAVGAAAWAAAGAAVGAAAGAAAWAAARDAARAALQPTAVELRDGMIALFVELVEARR
jgi:hypothetical protein